MFDLFLSNPAFELSEHCALVIIENDLVLQEVREILRFLFLQGEHVFPDQVHINVCPICPVRIEWEREADCHDVGHGLFIGSLGLLALVLRSL